MYHNSLSTLNTRKVYTLYNLLICLFKYLKQRITCNFRFKVQETPFKLSNSVVCVPKIILINNYYEGELYSKRFI